MSKPHAPASIESLRRKSVSANDGFYALPPLTTFNSNDSPSTLGSPVHSAWESTLPSAAPPDRSRLFKSKSKHNLAVFGAKLSSTAASVGVHTNKYKQSQLKDPFKESPRESIFEMTPESHIHDSPSGTTLKSKIFKPAKPDLKSLRIKTDLGAPRVSLGDRSPMVRGDSAKELDRIAAIGQTSSPTTSTEYLGMIPLHHHHSHHPHISFRKRDSPAAVLSSSASNSTLANEGTVYSFSQSTNNGQSAVSTLHAFKSKEEATNALHSSWSLLTQRIQCLYSPDETLRMPIEDVNILVIMHFSAHHALSGTGVALLRKLDDLLRAGLKASALIPRVVSPEAVAESWMFFHSKTLVYLEAAFLPLQLEFEAHGLVLTSPRLAREYWYPARRPSLARSNQKQPKLSIRQRVLEAYRDVVILPRIPKLLAALEDPECTIHQRCGYKLLQCFTVLIRLAKPEPELMDLVGKLKLFLRKQTTIYSN